MRTEWYFVLTGSAITCVALVLYVITWVLLLWKKDRLLLGGVESLWLRCLVNLAYMGIAVVMLGAIAQALFVFFFWRHI